MLGWVAFGATWHDAIVTAIAVLIITCPCALGLAIPAVQTVVSGAMFRTGVLLNSGDAIERLAEVDRVVFDKTGTLTLPELDVANAADIPHDVFELAGRLALASHHPVAAAVARAAKRKDAAGRGRRGRRSGRARRRRRTRGQAGQAVVLRRGSARQRNPVQGSRSIRRRLPSWRNAATSLRYGSGCARMRPAPSPRCSKAGIGVEILSGDREPAVRHAAQSLGIHEWRAGVTPADKIARIDELKRQGFKVMMVGDGMNDAPALAAAHVSMSPVTRHPFEPGHRRSGFPRRPPRARGGGHRLLAESAAADAAESVAGGRIQSAGGAAGDCRSGNAAGGGGGDVGFVAAGDT